MTIQLIRESLNAVVLNTVPRGRCFLMARLHKISEEGSVKGEDMMYIMAALAVLAESAFALRPRKQCFGMGSKLLIELQREAKEMTRKNVPSSVQQLSSCDPAEFIMETCRLIVRPIADAVSALITMDLLDNLERNTDADTFASERKLVPPPTQEGRATAWIDNSSAVIDILKKATTHANSLDRKASKRAILNASPPRTNAASAAASMDPKAGTASMSLGSPICGNSLVNLGASLSEGDFSHSMRHSNRAEHYFSFLRLYNQCENEGATSSDFFSRIIFLALQLDPSYVANYAKEKYGADGNAAQCGEMARFIMLNEEVPSTAEGIASRVPGTNSFSVSEAGSSTDGFLLLLMDMYMEREAATAAQAVQADPPAAAEGVPQNWGGSDSGSTLAPSEPDTADPLMDFRPQRDSPIRLPVTTDGSSKVEFPAAPHHQ
ncbi:cAMP-specific phosphodiesterase [Strigomonas culicis]|nr:cAMP-specific phosphodiesterase [Strigomonas culicis]|eukprot:EPY33273.1 cAMP-specific phosphodiesterase [Strigomonas culicis]